MGTGLPLCIFIPTCASVILRAGQGGDLHSVFSGTQEVQGVTALKGNNGSKVTWQDNTRQMLSSF